MGILIPRQLTKEQYIKLFSNPVSGIACDFGVVTQAENWEFIKNIRYSKSMILKALNFWFDQYQTYYMKLWHMRTAFVDMSGPVLDLLKELGHRMEIVRNCPDSFLFSHRYIKEVDVNEYRKYGTKNLAMINTLLNKKYEDIIVNNGFRPQVGTLDPHMPVMSTTGISFSIFANEHPYIPKQKISKVGMTDKGNVFILHTKGKGVQQINKPLNQAPKLYNKDVAQSVFPFDPSGRIMRGLLETWSNQRLFHDDELDEEDEEDDE
jgi:hypothetical protein